MKPRSLFLITIVLIVIGTIAVSLIWPPMIDNSFDNSPTTVVIRADLEINSGAPREGETCQYPSVPVLRIWDDGIVFLYDFDFQSQSTSLYKGKLSKQQLTEVIDFLRTKGFFGNWTPDAASPAGNYLHVGVSLERNTYEHTFSALPPIFYSELVEILKPYLVQFVRGQADELRIDSLNSYRECATPTP